MKMINKETPTGQPPAPGSNQEGAPPAGFSPQALMGLWNTYGPAVVSAVSKGRQQQPGAPSTSSVAAAPQQMPEPTHY